MAAEMNDMAEPPPPSSSSFSSSGGGGGGQSNSGTPAAAAAEETAEGEVPPASSSSSISIASSSSSSSPSAPGMEADPPLPPLNGEGAESMSEPSPESASQAGDGDDEEEEDDDEEEEEEEEDEEEEEEEDEEDEEEVEEEEEDDEEEAEAGSSAGSSSSSASSSSSSSAAAASTTSSSGCCCSDETRSPSPGGSEADAKEEAKGGPSRPGGAAGEGKGSVPAAAAATTATATATATASSPEASTGVSMAGEGEGEGGATAAAGGPGGGGGPGVSLDSGGRNGGGGSVSSSSSGSGADEGYSTGGGGGEGEEGGSRSSGGAGGGGRGGGGGGSRGGGSSTCSALSGGGRRGSLEISSDGEPLSRMDSEDSISSTIMDVDSTISSGRSTPVMMNGQGITASSAKSIAYNCCWDQCHACFNSSPDLADHIRSIHVDGQRGGVFVCLWKGCKVYNTPSTSQSWLQRHMLTHSGDKPFKCVVGGCNASFASQSGLARHVPTHFSQQNSSKVTNQPKAKEESPSKAGMNKRRKLKNKRRRSLPRPHDFFDAQTLDAIRHRAICFNLSAHIESLGKGHSVVFHSTVIAKRKEESGKIKLLLHWTPEDILPDVWVNESERHQLKTKVVHLSKLPKDTALLLDPNIYRTMPQKRLKR